MEGKKDIPNNSHSNGTAKPIPNGVNGGPNSLNGFMFQSIPASPPKFFTLEEIIKASDNLQNMALAHEIAVNKNFKLEKKEPETNLEKQVASSLKKAFWDILDEQLKEDPPCYTQAMVLLGEIKQALLDITLPTHTRLKAEINDTLDLDLIKQQLDHKALDFMHYAQWILDFCSKLCAPVRDEQIKHLNTLTEVTPLFRGILELLDELKLDLANFTIMQLRPRFQEHSIDYERMKFKEFIATQKAIEPTLDVLENTKNWLNRAFSKFSPEDKPTVQQVISRAYTNLLDKNETSPFPETLMLDEARFIEFKNTIEFVAWIASILMITYNNIPRDLQSCQKFKESLKNHVSLVLEGVTLNYNTRQLDDKFCSVSQMVVSDVQKILKERDLPLLDNNAESLLKAQIMELKSETHPVRCLFRSRILTFVDQMRRMSSNTQQVQIPAGLSALSKDLSTIIRQFLSLTTHNHAVFGEYYLEIIKPLLPPSQ